MLIDDDVTSERIGGGRRPELRDSELLCLVVAHIMLGYPLRTQLGQDRPSPPGARRHRPPWTRQTPSDPGAHRPHWSGQLNSPVDVNKIRRPFCGKGHLVLPEGLATATAVDVLAWHFHCVSLLDLSVIAEVQGATIFHVHRPI